MASGVKCRPHAKGSLVIFPTQRNSLIIGLGLVGKHPSGLLLISLLHMFRFFISLVKNLNSECTEAFMVASISIMWLLSFSFHFQAIFVGFSCASCSVDYEVFGFRLLVGMMNSYLVHLCS
jgi:hypothetical protein